LKRDHFNVEIPFVTTSQPAKERESRVFARFDLGFLRCDGGFEMESLGEKSENLKAKIITNEVWQDVQLEMASDQDPEGNLGMNVNGLTALNLVL
jgi:hypothetical protein